MLWIGNGATEFNLVCKFVTSPARRDDDEDDDDDEEDDDDDEEEEEDDEAAGLSGIGTFGVRRLGGFFPSTVSMICTVIASLPRLDPTCAAMVDVSTTASCDKFSTTIGITAAGSME